MPDVTILDALEEINPALKLKAILKSFVLLVSLCSLVCAFILVTCSEGWTFSNGYDFNTSTIDIFILTSLEVILFPIVAYLAVNATRSHLKKISMMTRLSEKATQFCEGCFKCNKQSASNIHKPYSRLSMNDSNSDFDSGRYNSHSLADGDSTALPLLAAYTKGSSESSMHTLNESSSSSSSIGNVEENISSSSSTTGTSTKNPLMSHFVQPTNISSSLEGYEEDDERRKEAKKRIDEGMIQTRGGADQMRTVWLFVMFLFSTSVQVFIGLKCISFAYSNESLQVTSNVHR